MFADQLHDQRLPRRVHPNGVRQLFCKRDGGREADKPGPLGYSGTRRLRQTATAVLPAD